MLGSGCLFQRSCLVYIGLSLSLFVGTLFIGIPSRTLSRSFIKSSYAKGRSMEEACKFFDEAKKKLSKLSRVTYYTFIHGFCKFEKYAAVNLLREMKDYKVHPNHDEYNISLLFNGVNPF